MHSCAEGMDQLSRKADASLLAEGHKSQAAHKGHLSLMGSLPEILSSSLPCAAIKHQVNDAPAQTEQQDS